MNRWNCRFSKQKRHLVYAGLHSRLQWNRLCLQAFLLLFFFVNDVNREKENYEIRVKIDGEKDICRMVSAPFTFFVYRAKPSTFLPCRASVPPGTGRKENKMDEAYKIAEQLEVPAFVVRDGTTTVIVGMYFNAKAKESVDDKVKRMIRGEVRAGNISESSGN